MSQEADLLRPRENQLYPKKGSCFFLSGASEIKFKMVEELSIEQQELGHCYQILEVSRSAYYDWLHRPLSLRKNEDQRIWEKIKHHWEKSRKT